MHFSGPNAFIGNGMSESSGNRFFFPGSISRKFAIENPDVEYRRRCYFIMFKLNLFCFILFRSTHNRQTLPANFKIAYRTLITVANNLFKRNNNNGIIIECIACHAQ